MLRPKGKGVLFIAIGVMLMLNFIGCGKSEFEFAKYSSRTPSINIEMDYLKGWTWLDHIYKEENYSTVIFVQLENQQRVFNGNMEADVFEGANLKVNPRTPEALADDIIAKRLRYPESKLVSRSQISLLGTSAIDIEMSFKMPEKLHAPNAKLIPLKARIVVFQKSDRFYVLKLMVREGDFAKYNRAFSHIIKSLRIKKL